MPTQPKPRVRLAKLNALLVQLLSGKLQELLEDTPGLTTISRVDVSPDLRHAKVWFSVLGGNAEKILRKLEHSERELRQYIKREMSIKIIPELTFIEDASPEYAQHISSVLDSLTTNDTRTELPNQSK